jgi:hypothetical protein
MHAEDLERVMTDFVAGKYNVLVCTTIIESGLDIPNCNTLIIEGADRFGLSQLYQLRGRVGRFKHQAYAYLLLHRHTRLLDAARQRMNTLRQHTSWARASGSRCATSSCAAPATCSGSEQSGHIVGVGFELYCQLLRQSVARLKGDKTAAAIRANVKLDFVFVGEGSPRGPRGPPRGRLHRDQGRRGQGRGPGHRADPGPDPRPTSARPGCGSTSTASSRWPTRARRPPDRGRAQGPVRQAGPRKCAPCCR